MTQYNLLKLKKIWMLCFIGVFSCVATWAKAAVPQEKPTVFYFGLQSAADFESKVKPLFNERTRGRGCEIVNHTPYTTDGQVDIPALKAKLESLSGQMGFIYFDFNLKVNESTQELVALLNKKTEGGMVVVGSAGVPSKAEASGPLSRTILGQTQGALIIGELGERDRLVPMGFYGPEMLTAVRPPKDLIGQGYAPLIFAAALAQNWNKKSGENWVEHFRQKKQKSRKIWLDLGDLF
ncbi:MAG: hypothetical protein AAGB31_05755 [Bdellovibrio sp.]